jgi:hypothetical protein
MNLWCLFPTSTQQEGWLPHFAGASPEKHSTETGHVTASLDHNRKIPNLPIPNYPGAAILHVLAIQSKLLKILMCCHSLGVYLMLLVVRDQVIGLAIVRHENDLEVLVSGLQLFEELLKTHNSNWYQIKMYFDQNCFVKHFCFTKLFCKSK